MTWPERVGVIGAGTMGHGIAQQFALHGRRVLIWDESPAARARVRDLVDANVREAVESSALEPAAIAAVRVNIAVSETLEAAVAEAELVVEAIVEQLEPKRAIFTAVERHAPPDAVLATNTSAIDIDAIAAACEDRSRVLGTHWFNPPHIVPGVEVIPGAETSPEIVTQVIAGLGSVGRVASVVGNTPGFVANRIQFAMIAEAFRCLDDGVADARTIDTIVRTTFGPRLAAFGIFEIADLAGLDVYTAILTYLERELDQPAFTPPESLREAVEQGRLGVKAGSGVYDYDLDAEDNRLALARALRGVFARQRPERDG